MRKRQPKIDGTEFFGFHTVYGAKTRQALVEITFRSERVLIPAAQARQLALDLLDTAHAADGDAFLVDWLKDRVKIEEIAIPQVLSEFRDHRIRKNGEK